MEQNESSAHGVRGYLLRTTDGELVFRVYTDASRSQYKDYKINHSDLEIQIVGNYSSLYEGVDGEPNTVDYPSRIKRAKKS